MSTQSLALDRRDEVTSGLRTCQSGAGEIRTRALEALQIGSIIKRTNPAGNSCTLLLSSNTLERNSITPDLRIQRCMLYAQQTCCLQLIAARAHERPINQICFEF